MRSPFGVAVLLLSCQAEGPDPRGTLRVDVEGVGKEAFRCVVLDAPPVAGKYLTAIRMRAPVVPVQIHHAALFWSDSDVPPTSCEGMEIDRQLYTWFQGGDDLVLPEGVGIALPMEARRLVVYAHVIRVAPGEAEPATLTVETRDDPPVHVAAALVAIAPVPDLVPRSTQKSTMRCSVAAPFHIVQTTPHMHRLGLRFESRLLTMEPQTLVTVDPWSFDQQASYPLSTDVAVGDEITTSCVWNNPTDMTVRSGMNTADEMCAQLLVVWPSEAAHWATCF